MLGSLGSNQILNILFEKIIRIQPSSVFGLTASNIHGYAGFGYICSQNDSIALFDWAENRLLFFAAYHGMKNY